jgi:hypothetical protein
MKKSFKILIFIDVILVIVILITLAFSGLLKSCDKEKIVLIPKRYESEPIVSFFSKKLPVEAEGSYFTRSVPKGGFNSGSDDFILAGVEVVGKVKNIDKKKKIINLNIKDQIIQFDISELEKIFALDYECNNLITLCKERGDINIELISKDEFFDINFKKNTSFRLFIEEVSDENGPPKVSEIIFQQQK